MTPFVFANPWGLLGLLSLPAIVAVHLFQRRFPPLRVSGLHLWGIEEEIRQAGRKRERLPITLSLILELLAALILTLALSQPRLGAAGMTTHLVVVLDDSASMQSVDTDDVSFRDTAIEHLKQRFQSLEPGSVVTLILTGRRPVMLAGPAVPWETAREKLAQWKPSAPRHDFHSAWDLAAQFAGESGQLLFLTDQVPDEAVPVPKAMEVVSLGRSSENIAFTAARWTVKPVENPNNGGVIGYRGEIFLRVNNFGTSSASVAVTATTPDKQNVFDRNLTIAAGGAESVTAIVPGGVGEIQVQIVAQPDALKLDSRLTLVEPAVKTVNVAVTLPPKSAAYRQIDRVLRILPHIRRVAPEAAQLLIGPAGTLPPSREDLWWLGIGPIVNTPKAKKAAVTPSETHPFVIEKRHPLMDDITLDGVKWGGVQPMKFSGTPLVSAGPHTLIARLKGTQTVAYVMNIDLERTTITDTADWPILLQNLIDLHREALPGLNRWNFRRDEEIRFRPPKKPDGDDIELTLVHNDETQPVPTGRVIHLPSLLNTGVYELRGEEKTIGRFAVNFLDQKESNLTSLSAGNRPPTTEAPADGFLLDEPHSWLILAGIGVIVALLLLNWYSLEPRPLRVTPDNIPLRKHLAETLLQRGRFDEAETELRGALANAPESAELKLALADVYHRGEKYSHAIVIVEDLVKGPNPSAQALLLHARLLVRTGDVPFAVSQYKLAIETDPDAEDPYLSEQLGITSFEDPPDPDAEIVDGRMRAPWEEAGESAVPDLERPKIRFSDVGGMESLKEEIRMKIIYPLQHREMFEAYGKPIGGGILMYGPPGCGKTHLARATAGEIDASFISVGISDVLDMWIGSSERRLHELFEHARRNTPCVLFFDEVDALGASRSDMRQSAGKHLINQFLSELDGIDGNNDGALTSDPHDPMAHSLLAICLAVDKKYEHATSEAQIAIAGAPDNSFCHYALSRVMFERNRLQDAKQAIEEAIRINPYDETYFAMLASIEFSSRKWKEALAAAERGLSILPDSPDCTNLRAMALVKLGRRDEAGTTIDEALRKDPNNPDTHSNQGWTLLEAGEPKEAMIHFREALRLDPNSDWARAGIVEAMKARNFIYRWLLAYLLWMGKLSGRVQWAVVLGAYFGMQIVQAVAANNPGLFPFLLPLIIAYVLFALLTWIGQPIFNLLLRINRFGRLALNRDQIVESNWIGAALLGGIVLAVCGLVFGAGNLLFAGLTCGLLMIPLSGTFRCTEGWPRKAMGLYTLGVAAVAVLAFASAELNWPAGALFLNVFFLSIFLSGFVGNALMSANPAR
eukprot:g26712.t1